MKACRLYDIESVFVQNFRQEVTQGLCIPDGIHCQVLGHCRRALLNNLEHLKCFIRNIFNIAWHVSRNIRS